jgi:hypothetical protein
MPPTLPTIGDAGFETVPLSAGSYEYSPTGSAWTFASGAGISANGSAFTSGNPAAPQGSQVAFVQATGTITQSVANWSAGSYTLSFDAAQRGNYGPENENFEILIDGVFVGTFKPTSTSYTIFTTPTFTVTAGSHSIAFVGLDTAGGDNTVFLDNVTLATATPPTSPVIGDSGFEAVSLAAGSYQYDPTGSAWTFASGAGVSANGSAFTSGNPSAPQGSQVAFIQGTGSFSQSVSGWAAGSYSLSFDAAQRANYGGTSENFEVEIDGVVVGTFLPSSTAYQVYATPTFTVATGTHTIAFVGVNTSGGDNTVFLDNVALAIATTPTLPTIGDSGFEAVSLAAGSYQYDPTGSAWTFASGAGVSANGSAFTSGNPSAPQGSQVAFIQGTGSFSQSVSGWAAGSYSLSFDAAQRANYGGIENFEVEIDGVVVTTFTPVGTSYTIYTTPMFTLKAGTHTISFVGVNSAGGDDTAFLDNVTLVAV